MYDCSKEFNKFYRTEVVLSAKEQNELREKRKLNIQRLKDGLLAYNAEKNTEYKIAENRIQGSMAMHTIVQNDENDYDIDVGIVFESDNLDDLGPRATRNMVANALERKTKQFAEAPDVKTSCIRLNYASTGYHVDFAVFKRKKDNPWQDEYDYEHAGTEWSARHIKALEEWFNDEVKKHSDNFRKIVRLSKMFCKSRDSWKNMPSGLIQTVLCGEQIATQYSRIDELFYYTMKAIIDRLEFQLSVAAPVDNGRPLVTREIDIKRMENWKSRLETNLEELDNLFDSDCSHEEAMNAWHRFFNHSYWEESTQKNALEFSTRKGFNTFDDTEEFIEDLYPIYEQYEVKIDCKVTGNGLTIMSIHTYLEKFAPVFKKFIPFNFSVECKIGETNCPKFDKVLWKVRNIGDEAERRNDIRGQIQDRGNSIVENTRFKGHHYIECYLIRNNICVAIGHVDVPIGIDIV